MPLEPEYTDKYEEGDLVYGLESERKDLMATKFKLSGPNIRTVSLATINNYATTWDEKQTVDSKVLYARPPIDEAAYREEIRKFNETLKSHGKYGTAVDWKAEKSDPLRDTKENEAWRKKCKGGLYYACFVAKKNVHFCVEGMDMPAVVNKTARSKEDNPLDIVEGEKKMRAVTNAELRWIYRNKEHEDVKKHIQFWKKDHDSWAPCAPPWADDAKLWGSYIPKRAKNVHGRDDD